MIRKKWEPLFTELYFFLHYYLHYTLILRILVILIYSTLEIDQVSYGYFVQWAFVGDSVLKDPSSISKSMVFVPFHILKAVKMTSHHHIIIPGTECFSIAVMCITSIQHLILFSDFNFFFKYYNSLQFIANLLHRQLLTNVSTAIEFSQQQNSTSHNSKISWSPAQEILRCREIEMQKTENKQKYTWVFLSKASEYMHII